ncbi:MAG: winged helix-turn-helix transcriptional regulator [Oscillospiraceae bacterium]
MEAGNQTLLKKNNQKAIINYIISGGAISRADLAKRLRISKPTVSANVFDLIEKKIITEIGYSETEIGKKPMLLDFNKEYKYVLALDFISYYTRNIVSFAICNLYCEPIFIEQIALNNNYSRKEVENDVPNTITDFLKRKKLPLSKIGRVVITAPSIVRDNFYAKFVCKNGDEVNLIDIFEKSFPNKIEVKNDINLAALG